MPNRPSKPSRFPVDSGFGFRISFGLRASDFGFASLLLLPLLFVLGCGSLSSSGGKGAINQLHLLGTPVAIDLDKKPGADGLGVRVYASSAETSQAIPIRSGSLEIVLFDGTVRREEVAAATPLVSVTYSASQLRKFEHKTAVGMSYNFIPAWGDHTPTKGRVTVVAIYRISPAAAPIRSAPITVPLSRS